MLQAVAQLQVAARLEVAAQLQVAARLQAAAVLRAPLAYAPSVVGQPKQAVRQGLLVGVALLQTLTHARKLHSRTRFEPRPMLSSTKPLAM